MECFFKHSFFMCISSVKIKNPNYGLSVKPSSFNKYKDCTSKYISVPCGHCFQCVNAWKMKLVQRAQMMSKLCVSYFCTFTYNNAHLPSISVNGYNIKYADFHHVQLMLKRLRNSLEFPFKYIFVSERGSKSGRPHFHLLFFVRREFLPSYLDQVNFESRLFKLLLSNWSINIGCDKKPIYEPLSTYIERFKNGKLNRTFDCHLVLPSLNGGSSDIVYYITKYLLKNIGYSDKLQQALKLNLEPSEYSRVWNIVKDRCVYSKNFGFKDDPFVLDYLRHSLDLSISDSSVFVPSFLDCESGKLVPMSKFYQKPSVKKSDMEVFYNRLHNSTDYQNDDSIFLNDSILDHNSLSNKIRQSDISSDLADSLSLFDESDIFFNS